MKNREEKDSLGSMHIPEDKLWGASTQRSLENFKIGKETFSREMIWAIAIIKKAAAQVNYDLKILEWEKSDAIKNAAIEVLEGKWDAHFPLVVWQTGSGTQTNMNANEVIANRAIQLLGGQVGDKSKVHPNDDVNKSQSSNDVIPTAMHIALVEKTNMHLLPALDVLSKQFRNHASSFNKIIKTGRTHLMDAAPIQLSQVFLTFASQLDKNKKRIENSLTDLLELPIGGTAVGTGLNTIEGYDTMMVKEINKETQRTFISAPCKFEHIASHDAIAHLSASLKTLSLSLMKIANDIRWMGSGPRAGLSELILPTNEPGSSIMPGKVNPTQCEALTMVCAQVMGNDSATSIGGMSGSFELNAFKPLMISNTLSSVNLLGAAMKSFSKKCIDGLKVNEEQIKKNLDQSLMLATALNPHIGYDKASEIVYAAHNNKSTLKAEAIRLGYLTAAEFDKFIDVQKMTQPSKRQS